MLWTPLGKPRTHPARWASWSFPQGGTQWMCGLKSLCQPLGSWEPGEWPPLPQPKTHNFLRYQVVRSGVSEAPECWAQCRWGYPVLTAATTSGLLATGASHAVLGDNSGCHGVTELPLLSRGLINGNPKESTPWIKLSRPKTWLLTSPQLWNPESCPIFIITLFLIIIKSLRSEVSATTAA